MGWFLPWLFGHFAFLYILANVWGFINNAVIGILMKIFG